MNFLSGYKTYIIVGLFVLLAILITAVGIVVPDWLFGVLAGLGFATIRLAIQAISGNKGWRTYFAAIMTAFISIANSLGWGFVTDNVELLYTLSVGLGVVGVRKAVSTLKG